MAIMKRIRTFINTCLRRILKIRWPDIHVSVEMNETHSNPSPGTPQGKRKRGRPRNSWCCDVEVDMRRNGYMWGELLMTEQCFSWWPLPQTGYR